MAPTGTSNMVNLIVRGIQAFFAIIVLGISASLLHDYAGSPSQFGFNLFTSLWTLLVCIFSVLALSLLSSIAHPIGLLVIEALSWLFWLAAWACAASTLHRGYAYSYQHGKEGALTAFGVLEWLLFCYTLYAAVMAFLDNRRGYSGKNSGAQTAV